MNTKTYRVISALRCSRRLVLTGTPLQNDLTEFLALVTFVGGVRESHCTRICPPPHLSHGHTSLICHTRFFCQGLLGSPANFERIYKKPIDAGFGEGASANERRLAAEKLGALRKLCSDVMLCRGKEVNEDMLPDLHEIVVVCKLTPLQQELYGRLLAMRGRLRSTNHHAMGLQLVDLLRKTCAHPYQVYFSYNDLMATEAKEKSEAALVQAAYCPSSPPHTPCTP